LFQITRRASLLPHYNFCNKTGQKTPKNTFSETLRKPGLVVMNSDASLPNILDGTGPEEHGTILVESFLAR
jgi:hypothetical protein